jgi:hypothetical protein
LDVETLSQASDTHALTSNEIGRVEFILQKPIAADLFDQSQRTGAFILIDEATNHTVAAGMIREAIAQSITLENEMMKSHISGTFSFVSSKEKATPKDGLKEILWRYYLKNEQQLNISPLVLYPTQRSH